MNVMRRGSSDVAMKDMNSDKVSGDTLIPEQTTAINDWCKT